ncbi:hypothetical protein MKW92_051273 [Papaver armeniacum]|nr:hypothetical protein MKW92_051273 [Papaver armeniacum]
MLEDLAVFNMGREFVTLPEWSGNLSSLKFLQIRNCIGLVYLLPEDSIRLLTSLWCLRIDGISEEPEVFQEEAHGIQNFISLHSLEIHGWSKLHALPHQLQHLINLKKIVVEDFDGLVALPEWVGHLSSLKELVLRSCKNLMHLPSKKAMQRLTKLCAISIKACPLFEERCAYKTGEEWEKISHIEEISIG